MQKTGNEKKKEHNSFIVRESDVVKGEIMDGRMTTMTTTMTTRKTIDLPPSEHRVKHQTINDEEKMQTKLKLRPTGLRAWHKRRPLGAKRRHNRRIRCNIETKGQMLRKTVLDFMRRKDLFFFLFFLDAFSHLYKRVCLSVGPSVGPSVRRSVRPKRVEFLRNKVSGLNLNKLASGT